MRPSIHRMPDPLRGIDGGFTYVSIVKRLPQILDKTLQSLHFEIPANSTEMTQLDQLKKDLMAGTVPIEPLKNAPQDDAWRSYFAAMEERQKTIQTSNDGGHDKESGNESALTWINAPWWFAENYFYRKILDILQYFSEDSPYYMQDPFKTQKDQSIVSALDSGAVHRLAEVFDRNVHTDKDSAEQRVNMSRALIRQLVVAALWGNQADLSFSAGEIETSKGDASKDEHILVNDVELALDRLFHKKDNDRRPRHVVYITDNCGLEFICDMFLCDALVELDIVERVRFLVKDVPVFVSDVMVKDVAAHIRHMQDHSDPLVQKYARQFQANLDSGKWQLEAHPFYSSPLYGWEWPSSLVEQEFKSNESRIVQLVVSKGDANYRRLLGDCHWDPCEHDFQEILSQYMCAPILALRTMKSGCLVLGKDDQSRELFNRLNASEENKDPNMTWRENGKYGIICFCDPDMSVKNDAGDQ